MNRSEIINLVVSVVSILIALLALFQSKKQLALSNKQKLFDRRLTKYLEFKTILRLYRDNRWYLDNEDIFFHMSNSIFTWLTNCSNLEDMAPAFYKPLQSDEQKILLTKCEQLKESAVEISMIFGAETGEIASEFVVLYSDLLKGMYQQRVYIVSFEKEQKKFGQALSVKEYESKCKTMAESLGLFETHNKLEEKYKQITDKKIVKALENELQLTKGRK